ncbi:MAG: hypothetical protein KAS07_03265 [Candidatus Pacebacteria bacterium]|nr:hypothetical protein [Candidatus Paceibacterota bacterium]
MNQELHEYIQVQLKKGVSKEEISKILTEQGGWAVEEVERVFSLIEQGSTDVGEETQAGFVSDVNDQPKSGQVSKFAIIAFVSFFVLLVGVGFWWYVSSHRPIDVQDGDRTVQSSDESDSAMNEEETLDNDKHSDTVEEKTDSSEKIETDINTSTEETDMIDPETDERHTLADASGLTIKTTEEVVEVHLYNADGLHTGMIDTPEGSDLRFYEAKIPNTQMYGDSMITLDVGDPDYSGDDYFRIEILGLRYGTTEFTIADGSNENDLSKIYVPMGPNSKGSMTIEEGNGVVDINKIQYDIDGDETIDYELSHIDGVSAGLFVEMAEVLLDSAELEESEKQEISQLLDKSKNISPATDMESFEVSILEDFGDIFSNDALYQDASELSTYETFLRMVLTSIIIAAGVE